MDVINEIILQVIASPWLYLILFALTVLDGFFPPVPSETVLVAAAAVAASAGGANLILLGVVAALGAAVGDNIAFLIGRRLGTTRFAWMRRPRVSAAFSSARHALDHRSAALLLSARYIPVGRVVVNMSAGAVGFRWSRFVPLSVVGAVSWSVFSIAVGLLAGSWIKDQPLLSAAVGVVLALLIGLLIDRVIALRRRRALVVSAPSAPPRDRVGTRG